MPSIHFICHENLHLHRVSDDGQWESGNWAITKDEAEKLIGGMIYLHKKKAKLSYFGGRIKSFRTAATDGACPDKFVFRFEQLPEANNVRWKGSDHSRAWKSGVVED